MSREANLTASGRPADKGARWPVRIASFLLAGASLLWVSAVFPNVSEPQLGRIAGRTARGETYDPGMLRQIISTNTTGARRLCDPKVVRQLLILQLSVADSSTHSVDLQAADKDIAGVDALARTLLTCAPAESVGWLGVYWAAIQKDGFGPKTSALLDQSFHFAPHEAWIQLIRAPLVLRSYDSLSPSLKIAVEQDFEDIFKAQLYPSAAQLFKRATIAGRQKLLDRTCAATDNERALFRHFVTEAGIGIIRHSCYPLEELPFMPRT